MQSRAPRHGAAARGGEPPRAMQDAKPRTAPRRGGAMGTSRPTAMPHGSVGARRGVRGAGCAVWVRGVGARRGCAGRGARGAARGGGVGARRGGTAWCAAWVRGARRAVWRVHGGSVAMGLKTGGFVWKWIFVDLFPGCR